MKALITRMYGQYLNFLGYVAPRLAAKRGFMLFCRPFKLPLNEKQVAFFNTAEQFNMVCEGVRVQGYKWGSGPKKLLFLHGWQSHTYRWKAYIESLSKEDYSIYSLDAPGHGLSEGNFLSVPLYSTVIENFVRDQGPLHTVAAHSLGSFSLLYTIYKNPALPVNKLLLMAPPGEATDFIRVFQETLRLNDKTVQLVLNYFVETYNVSPEFFSTAKFAASIDRQGLIIHDEGDEEAPFHYSPKLNAVWKKSKLISTKGFGHNLKSPTVIKHVVDFIESPVHEHAYD